MGTLLFFGQLLLIGEVLRKADLPAGNMKSSGVHVPSTYWKHQWLMSKPQIYTLYSTLQLHESKSLQWQFFKRKNLSIGTLQISLETCPHRNKTLAGTLRTPAPKPCPEAGFLYLSVRARSLRRSSLHQKQLGWPVTSLLNRELTILFCPLLCPACFSKTQCLKTKFSIYKHCG